MKRYSVVAVLAVLGLLSQSLWAQLQAHSAPEFHILGTLISGSDGSPVHRGHVVAAYVDRGRDGALSQEVFTSVRDVDEQGRFDIALPTSGAWWLIASAPGFASGAYQQHRQLSTAVVVSRESPSVDLRFELRPGASISGTVLDEAGEPVRQAKVKLLSMNPRGPDKAQPDQTVSAVCDTDDRGDYAFDGLAAGSYRIQVQAQPWYAVAAHPRQSAPFVRQPADPSLDLIYPVTWYPGVDNAAGAETLTLKAGETDTANFRLNPIPSMHFHLAAQGGANAPPNDRAATQRLQSAIQNVSDGNQSVYAFIERDAEGGIDVGGLTPGVYQVELGGRGQIGDTSIVEVADGGAKIMNQHLGTVAFGTRPSTSSSGRLPATTSNSRAPSKESPATVTGTVTLNGVPAAGVLILLVPSGADASSRVLRTDQSDTAGGIYLPNVSPGSYALLAVANGWQIDCSDPSVLRHYLPLALAVELLPGSKIQRNITARLP